MKEVLFQNDQIHFPFSVNNYQQLNQTNDAYLSAEKR